ncbi:MAG: tetratricopeptide repeat protein [Candidatus Thorarchaeota archaeon]
MVQGIRKWNRNRKATNLLFKAVEQEQQGMIAEAEDIYQKLIGQYPEFVSGWTSYGTFLFSQGKKESAIDLMKRAADLLTLSPEPLNRLGAFLQAEQQFDDALLAFQEAVERDSDDVSSWSAIASTSQMLGKNELIYEAYANITRINPNTYHWWAKYGDFLLSEQNYVEAEKSFKHALELNPRCYLSWVKLGICHFKQGEYEKSVNAFNTAIQIEPFTEYAYHYLGHFLEKKGLIDSSFRDYLDTIHPLARRSLSSSMSFDGPIFEVESKYKKLAEDNPDSEFILNLLATCYLIQSKYKEAESVLRHVIELNPDSFEGLSNLGIALIKQNKVEEGKRTIRRAIATDPSNPRVRIFQDLVNVDY